VSYVAQEVNKIPDGTQRLTQLESLVDRVQGPHRPEVINPILVGLYFSASRSMTGFALHRPISQRIRTTWLF